MPNFYADTTLCFAKNAAHSHLEIYSVVTPEYSPTESTSPPPSSPPSASGFCPITPRRPVVSPRRVFRSEDEVVKTPSRVEKQLTRTQHKAGLKNAASIEASQPISTIEQPGQGFMNAGPV
jgi:hypothetical protein